MVPVLALPAVITLRDLVPDPAIVCAFSILTTKLVRSLIFTSKTLKI